jgi:hypothetical protein
LEQISHPLSTPLSPLENNIQPPPKRRRTTHEAVTHLIGKENKSVEIASAVMKAAKIPASYINVSSDQDSHDFYFFSPPKELLKLEKFDDQLVRIKVGTCVEDETASQAPSQIFLPDDYLHQTLYQSKAYSFLLKLDQYHEVSIGDRQILNRDWMYGEEVRLASAQLLGGAILVDGEQLLFINTAEVYARSPSLDVHHERLDPVATFSSVPTPSGPYNNLSVLAYENDNSRKLIIGTYSFNALVTSSIRLDLDHDLETGPSTKNFSPSPYTKIFIANTSQTAVNDIIRTKKSVLYDFDTLHQLRQLRSRLTSPSTYSISRASSLLTNHISCRPYTVFTIVDSGSSSNDTDEILACMVLRSIALKVLNNRLTISKHEIDDIVKLKKGSTTVTNTIKSISSLMKENESMAILHNQELETHLSILASIITKKLPTFNENVKSKFKQRIEYLNKSSK